MKNLDNLPYFLYASISIMLKFRIIFEYYILNMGNTYNINV